MPLLICPNCNVGMTQVKRAEVEIDMCPQCRGVWLDRGELEKLLLPLREQAASDPPSDAGWDRDHRRDHDDDHHRHGDDHHDRHGRNNRRQGWRNILDAFD